MPFRDDNIKIRRNEIFESGEIINAYSSSHWTGNFLGNIKLLRRASPLEWRSQQEDWWVEYVTGHGSMRYRTITPEAVSMIGN